MQPIQPEQMKRFYDGADSIRVPVCCYKTYLKSHLHGVCALSKNKAQPLQVTMLMLMSCQEVLNPDPMSGFAVWTLVAHGSAEPAFLWT